MASGEYPTLNEFEPSWADVRSSFTLYGGETVLTDDIAAVKLSDKLEISTTRGTGGGKKRKRTVGQVDNDMSITFYFTGWKRFRNALAVKDKRIGLVGWDLIFQLTPPGSSEIYTIKAIGCRVAGRSFDFAEGPDAAKVEIPINLMEIEEDDGITLL